MWGNANALHRIAPRDRFRAPPPRAVPVPQELASLASFATFTAVVVIHELGHFTAARLQGIRVQEFSIGFGPPLLSRQANDGINYTLRALPLGGYVSFPQFLNRTLMEQRGWLKPDKNFEKLGRGFQDETGPDLLENRPLQEQALVAVAGVVANVCLTWALFFAAANNLGIPQAVAEPVTVISVVPSSTAEAAGLQPGDRVLSMGDVILDPPGTAFDITSRGKQSSLGITAKAIRIAIEKHVPFASVVERNGEQVSLAFPAASADQKSLGVRFESPQNKISRAKASPLLAASFATRSLEATGAETFGSIGSSLASLIAPESKGTSSKFTGPLGIVRMGSNVATEDARNLFEFGALLSLNLAIFNSLPLPALDGWLLALLAAEAILKRPIPAEAKQGANNFAVLFLSLAAFRVLLSDLADAGGTMGIISRGVAELGPSVAASIIIFQLLADRLAREERLDDVETKSAGGDKQDQLKITYDIFFTWLKSPRQASKLIKGTSEPPARPGRRKTGPQRDIVQTRNTARLPTKNPMRLRRAVRDGSQAKRADGDIGQWWRR